MEANFLKDYQAYVPWLSVPKEYGIIVESVASKIKFLVRTGMCTLKKLV